MSKNNKKLLDDLFPIFKEETFNHINKDYISRVTKQFYNMESYKYGYYVELAIKKFILDFFNISYDRMIRRSDSNVKIYLIPTKNPDYYYFIHIDSDKLKNIAKVNLYNLKYMINGKITKGKLKGNKKDKEIINQFITEFTPKNIRKLVPKKE